MKNILDLVGLHNACPNNLDIDNIWIFMNSFQWNFVYGQDLIFISFSCVMKYYFLGFSDIKKIRG